ncbi:polysaccharide biosynthesis protein [Fervidobacterium sp. SC_NGM5_O18]|uniref:DegT/DnrJ/EryC1/StrS family aminotransferase n=1 Tax=Fervidobacterium pennivorans TaxID=93466 RepID=A0A172T1F3_FERPE|nr:DegT/DnrJ/EryC1/StrS family aminotransferase [Fervidobacterium pennivorans]ANE40762.1 polysaccharide biosynthesis protein [Fervidobacterium pennivorans]MDM7320575.1 DegT/DnrJ/EryC1/StrS family aminotransferase [Fervidobacterium sp.]PHJ12267.1 polysaccharide biosynthesis protein [Fervidobacterium sp. SC_NGM5_O18]
MSNKEHEKRFIPLSKPQIAQEDIETVTKVLKSGRLSIGPYTELFEKAIAEYVGVKYAAAVSSGTSALHLILKALNFGKGDLLIVPSFTFVASANVALYENGSVTFVDIDPITMNMDIEHFKTIVEENFSKFRRIFLMAVDIFGHPLDWDKVNIFAEKYDVTVVEDSCEALGSEYKGKKVGTFGVAGAFAFYPNKQITTGEGGVVVTNSEKIYKLSVSLRNQGRGEGQGWLSHNYVGYNYRIDEMSAALGWSQMQRLDEIIEKRAKVAERYKALLKDLPLEVPVVMDYVTKMSWFVYVVRLPQGTPSAVRDKIIQKLENEGVQCRNYFSPVHLQKPYRELGWKEGMLPVTEDISQRTIAIPFYTDMEQEDQEYVAQKLRIVLETFLK